MYLGVVAISLLATQSASDLEEAIREARAMRRIPGAFPMLLQQGAG